MFAPKYSVGTLCFYGLTYFKSGVSTKNVRGSSRYEFQEGELVLKNKCYVDNLTTQKSYEDRVLNYREYKLNKKIVRRKVFAFYHLPNASRYFRLWTLTFPEGTGDYYAYRLLNNFLTRLRTECELKDYIWVAERQKNNTLHFHLIFSKFISIKKANKFALTAIKSYIKKGWIKYSLDKIEKYNGLDVSKKCGSFKSVAKYLTKYVTKNNTTCARLPYYCSQSISRLFTCIWVSDDDIQKMIAKGDLQLSKECLFQTEYFEFFGVQITDYRCVFSQLIAINEYVYNYRE